ncbi:hypothetical protein AVEN_121918-1 [Araneus ventricosus]|uniref:Uncharacterized protein n=1 Tax=Araneus ventricosus TaxID=182803 RepID=A0A4Y2J4E6_ARAVE|nr:hypothetical protein AVEN_121918-1 [Araneus ventricosus]
MTFPLRVAPGTSLWSSLSWERGRGDVTATMRNNALSPEEKLCNVLRFFASGTQQQILGDLSEVSQSSSCRAVNQVALHLAKLRLRYVYLPNEVERREVNC